MSADDALTISDSQFEVSLGGVGPGSLVFGRYRLQKELGRGGMGVVWLAQDERVDVPVALKFLPDIVARDAESVDELKRELRRGLSLTHPGIVRVYSFEQDGSGAAIAMEYVDGATLSSLKQTQGCGCFDAEDLLPLVEQLGEALHYAHTEAKIVHRDLKPRNLMLTTKGRLKVADFGVATSISETVSRVTNRRDGSGTPPYMSPQQAFGENPSPSDDMYSLGATLYDLLTGRPPFYQGNILAQVQQRVPPSLQERREVLKIVGKNPIPPSWERTISSMLSKLPEDRPQSMTEMISMLKGEIAPPTGGHTETRPINPALTADVLRAGNTPSSGGSTDDTTTQFGGQMPTDPPTEKMAVPEQAAPAAEKKQNPLAAVALLGVLVAFGAATFWWQSTQDAAARAKIAEQRANAPTVDHTPVATPLPVAATPLPVAATPLPVATPSPTPNAMSDKAADEEAASQGRIPRLAAPWENSLHMKFVPVTGQNSLIGIHEVRVVDYREFATATKREHKEPEFQQDDDHPVVNVSWNDAVSFCDWLTRKERAEGTLGKTQRYRLLTDAEWSRAIGTAPEQGSTPKERGEKDKTIFPWGNTLAPPDGTENLAGTGETTLTEKELVGYRDGFTHTSPVGRFARNVLGIYDLPGNVSEWVEDWYDETTTERTTRGAAFIYIAPFDRASTFRWHLAPNEFADYIGFRIAIDPVPKR